MATQILEKVILADVQAASWRTTRVETSTFPEPNQEWSAVLLVASQEGVLLEWELEQFVLSLPGGRPRTFSAAAIERSCPPLAQALRAEATKWLQAKVAARP